MIIKKNVCDDKKYFVMINYNVMRFSINNEKLHLDYIQ